MPRLLAIYLLISASICTAKAPMQLAFSDTYAPLSWSVEGEMKGIIVDVLNEALVQRMGIQASFQGFPWSRAQKLVENRFADAFVTVPTNARRKYTQCSKNPVLTVEVRLYTYVNHPQIEALSNATTYDDLSQFTIIEYLGNGWAKEKFKNLKVLWVPNLEQTYKMLAIKRGDVLVRNSFNFHYFMRNLDIQNAVVELPVIFSSVDFHLCIQKSSPYKNLLAKFDAVISGMKASGIIDEISSRYRH